MMGDLSAHFSRAEFACKCGCGFDVPNMNLVLQLEILRRKMGRPIIINSGCRCAKHNAEVGGKIRSSHLSGSAADVLVKDSHERYIMLNAIFDDVTPIFPRIEICKSWIHCDVAFDKPQEIAILEKEA